MTVRYKVKMYMDYEDETGETDDVLVDYSGTEWDTYDDAKIELALAQDLPHLAGYYLFIDTEPSSERPTHRAFNRFMQLDFTNERDAIRTAALNAAAVINLDTDLLVCDYRTPETENDERG
jgi:hypothetical protein